MATTPGKEKDKGGRPVGSVNKITAEVRKWAAESGELPHEFLLRMTRGEVITRKVADEKGNITEVVEHYDLDARRAAAVAAAPYFASKLATVELIQGMKDDDLDKLIAEFATQAGIAVGAGGEGEADESGSGETGSSQRRRRITFDD